MTTANKNLFFTELPLLGWFEIEGLPENST
jgi:hypothetical protein